MKIFLAAALLLVPFAMTAQDVKLENDTIYKDGKAYGLVIKSGKLANSSYSVKTLTNVEIAVVKFDEATKKPDGTGGYFRFTFLGSGAFGHLLPGFNPAKGIATVVVENDLIKDNAVNPEGEKRFLALYPNKLTNQPTVIINVNNNTTSVVDYTTAQRSKTGSVFANMGTLTQGGVDIGTYKSSVSHTGGKSTETIQFYLPNGVKCAESISDNIGAKTATVTTFRDNRTHTVSITNSAVKEKEIAQFLADNNYL